MVMLVVPKAVQLPLEHPSPEVNKLLSDFSKIAPADLLDELPPMRDIQHQISLILGSNPHNLPHY